MLYAFYQDEERDVVKTKKALDHSINKMHELYILLLMMIGSMQSFAIERIEAGRKKQLPTQEDLHPNTKFVTNRPLRALANSKNLVKAASDLGIGWGEHQEMFAQNVSQPDRRRGVHHFHVQRRERISSRQREPHSDVSKGHDQHGSLSGKP